MNMSRLPEKQYYDACRNTFSHFDKDKDNYLSREEFGHMLMQLQE